MSGRLRGRLPLLEKIPRLLLRSALEDWPGGVNTFSPFLAAVQTTMARFAMHVAGVSIPPFDRKPHCLFGTSNTRLTRPAQSAGTTNGGDH